MSRDLWLQLFGNERPMDWTRLREAADAGQPERLDRLRELVEHESPSRDKTALDALADRIASWFRGFGAEVGRIPNPRGGDHLRLRWNGDGSAQSPALLLGHFDTVWPTGTIHRMPFRVEDGRAFGPGCYDMKAGLVVTASALGALRATGAWLPRPVIVLLTSDEEIGSPTSRALIENEARGSAYALVLEPPLPDGRLKTQRKGIGQFLLEIEGKAAHAGVEPEKGVSAIKELAHQVLAIDRLNAVELGTTLNVGVVEGGTASNVVAARASAQVDVRVRTMGEASRIEHALRSVQPVTTGARVAVSGGFNRPPMERTPEGAALFERARAVGRSLGLALDEGATGGGSDGNFTAAVGTPTLDGLGVLGSGAHADHEQIVVDSLSERTLLLAALLLEL